MADGVRSASRYGFIGAVAIWHLCLVGMVETFAERELIGEAITMGYLMMAAIVMLVGYVAGRKASAPPHALLFSAISGGMTGIGILLLILATDKLHIGEIFPFATPHLIELLTLGIGIESLTVLLVPLLAGVVVGVVGGALTLLPPDWRRSVTLAFVTITLLGLMRDVIAVLLPSGIRKIIFTSSGLTYPAAAVLLLLSGAGFWAQTYFQERARLSSATRALSGETPQRTWRWWAGMVVLSLFLLTFPMWSKSFLSNVASFVGLYIIMGLGLNLVIGFAGMLDLGFVAFYAIGAYTMAILTSPAIASSYYNQPVETGFLTFWQALPFSMIAALIGGTLLALPILKMRGDYLAIATLGFGEIIRILVQSDFLKSFERTGPDGETFDVTFLGGAQGITRIARPEIGDFMIKDPEQFYYLILIGCLLALFISFRLKKSRMGRAWMAIREDEDVAQAMGINRVTAKLWAFVIGAFLGGLSGGIFASMLGSVVPKSFELLISINVLALIIVGGMGSLPGVVVGAVAMVGLPEMLREFGEYRMLVYGAVVVVMMLYRPQGLWPESVVAREVEEARAKQAEQEHNVAESNRPPPSAENQVQG
jgi:branched-chain amino acid transport system permease protein